MNNSNNSTDLIELNDKLDVSILKILSYIPLLIILIGVIFNTLTFLIIILNKDLRKITSMVYLSYISITYTLSLLEWNLNHFLKPNFGIDLEALNIITCKLVTFTQYFSLQSSGFLLTILCIDRYVTVISTPGSLASRLPFRTPKSAHIWSLVIMGLVFILNSHILIFNRINEENKTTFNFSKFIFDCNTYHSGFKIYPIWDNVHLILYNLISFIIMIIFNSLLIKKIKSSLNLKNSKLNNKKDSIKRNIISVLFITFLFLFLTVPSSIAFGCFNDRLPKIVLIVLDDISFLNNTSLFFTCFLTNLKFKKVIINLLKYSDSKYRKPKTNTQNHTSLN